jgi:hypothetical protein
MSRNSENSGPALLISGANRALAQRSPGDWPKAGARLGLGAGNPAQIAARTGDLLHQFDPREDAEAEWYSNHRPDRPAEDLVRAVALLLDLPNTVSVVEFTAKGQLEESYEGKTRENGATRRSGAI